MTESRFVVARGWEEGGNGSDCLMGTGLLWMERDDEIILELDSGVGCTMM